MHRIPAPDEITIVVIPCQSVIDSNHRLNIEGLILPPLFHTHFSFPKRLRLHSLQRTIYLIKYLILLDESHRHEFGEDAKRIRFQLCRLSRGWLIEQQRHPEGKYGYRTYFLLIEIGVIRAMTGSLFSAFPKMNL